MKFPYRQEGVHTLFNTVLWSERSIVRPSQYTFGKIYDKNLVKKIQDINRFTTIMKLPESLGIITIGCLIAVENFLVILAAIRNKGLRENTHYNLVISLSVCDFAEGLILILYGGAIARNNDANQAAVDILCTVFYCVGCVNYHTSLQQTFSISLNRYLVITENKLSKTLWNGNRKYLVFCGMITISLIIDVPLFSTSLQGCGFQIVLDNGSKPSLIVLGSVQTIILLLTFVFYFLTLWNIFKMHHKTDIDVREQTDESKQRNVRKRKRMLNSMKVVGFILLALLVSLLPAVVFSFRGLSSSAELLFLILFAKSSSVLNPIINCIHIKELCKEVKIMLRIKV